jgi:hypothetical protein
VAISVVIVAIQFKGDIKNVQAEKEKNVSGFAWSSNYGWISFNSIDCDADDNNLSDGIPIGCPALDTPIPDYGVNIDNDGNFSGYAWSNNIGWIQFDPAGPYPGAPLYSAKRGSDFKITGWAKVLSLGGDGWLKMSDDSVPEWNGKGVSIRGDNSFIGWAWNGDADQKIGLGWVSFNSENPEDADSYSYGVKYDASNLVPSAPTNLQANMQDCNTMGLTWDDNSSNEDGFQGQFCVTSNDCTLEANWLDIQNGECRPVSSNCTVTMPASTEWKFRVKAWSVAYGDSAWSNEALGSTSYCPVKDLIINSYDCSSVNLSWNQIDSGAVSYDIMRSEDGISFTSIGNVAAADPKTFVDTNIESGIKYYYKIITQTEGLESNIVNVTPCPNTPSWQEVNP